MADDGGTKEASDCVVEYAQEAAEGTYELVDEGEFEFVEPDGESCRLEVLVADRGDGRFVPYCTVRTSPERDGETVEVTFEEVDVEAGQG